MATRAQRAERRTDALSKERIVAAAIEILDTEGEAALTFRALAARLATGSGAIYWHVANKDELLAAATDGVIARAMAGVVSGAEPRAAIRSSALAVFDAIDAHPWVGTQLSREPWQPALVQIFEGLGRPLQALGVPVRAQFRLRDRAGELHPRPGRAVRRGRPSAVARYRPGRVPGQHRRPVGPARPGQVPVRAPDGDPVARPSTTASSSWPGLTSSWPASPPSAERGLGAGSADLDHGVQGPVGVLLVAVGVQPFSQVTPSSRYLYR